LEEDFEPYSGTAYNFDNSGIDGGFFIKASACCNIPCCHQYYVDAFDV
jgi:hypothetical protein